MAKHTRLLLILLLAISAFGEAPPEPVRVDHIGLVASNVIEITLSAGRVEYGRQVPYAKQKNDDVLDPKQHRFVKRDGKIIGTLVGKKADVLCSMDQCFGERFDPAWADSVASYLVSSIDDPRYHVPLPPKAVFRKSKPGDLGMVGQFKFDYSTENMVYLELPIGFEMGKTYIVTFRGSRLPARSFTLNNRLRSSALHVSQIGFRPDDPAKMAFLSCWMGSGGGLKCPPVLNIRIVEDATGITVFESAATLAKAAYDKNEDAYKKNYNGTDVYEMDFTALEKPGRYRVCINAIGCSYPFEIGEDVWRKAFTVSAHGFYHQRSGIALGEPFTSYKRPRAFHPADGLVVYASTTPLIDTGSGLNQKDSNFGNLVKGKTDEIVANLWGGYMDAGGWNRRIQHLKSTLLLLELAELFPEYFAGVSLRIPESGNGLPDIVNEALFNLDFYRRLQQPQGGVRGGIESSDHPRRGETSSQESLTVMTYAPDVFSSCFYAGVAARASRWLATRAPEQAAIYRESALRAMNWAEADREREEKCYLMAKHPAVRDARNFAAAELFCLTGDPRWNELFLATTIFKQNNAPIEYNCDSLDQGDSAWVYARTERQGVNAIVKANCRKTILSEANSRVASTWRTAFRWGKAPWMPVVYGALSSPENCVCVARAHVLTGEAKYLRSLVLASQTGAGANPLNMCYTTGLGVNPPKHPLQFDYRITHQPPPPGITVGGPMDCAIPGLKDPFIETFADGAIFPERTQWPALESFWDVYWDPMVCEYTIHKPMAGNAYVWGYLAARARIE